MAEDTPSSISSERHSDHPANRHRGEDAPRGERASGPREGGFRIRLSDNEMRSARALQEAFGLRSTVAVLGFALRTLGQQLEEGKLDDLVAQHKAQMGTRGAGGGGGRPEGRRERPEGRSPGGRWQEGRAGGGKGPRVDPFARPSRPASSQPPAEDLSPESEGFPEHEQPLEQHEGPFEHESTAEIQTSETVMVEAPLEAEAAAPEPSSPAPEAPGA